MTASCARLVPVLSVSALLAAACGEVPSAHPEILLEFPNALPTAPKELDEPARPWTSSHPIAVTEDEVFVADSDNGALVVLDRESLEVVRTVAVGERPQHVTVGPDGTAWVTVRGSGKVVRIAPGGSGVAATIPVGVQPFGVALSPEADLVYVTLHAEGELVVLDAETSVELLRRDAGELVRGLAVTETQVVVVQERGNAVVLPLKNGIPELLAGEADHKEVALRLGTPVDRVFRPNREARLHATRATAVAVHPKTGRGLVVHNQAEPGEPEDAQMILFETQMADEATVNQSSGGYGGGSVAQGLTFQVPQRPVEMRITEIEDDGTEVEAKTRAFPVQDPQTGEPMTALLDSPSDIAHHPTHTIAFVTGEGTDNVLAFNTLDIGVEARPIGVISVGMMPKGIAFSPDGAKAYVLNAHSFTVSEVSLAPLLDPKRVPQRLVSDDAVFFPDDPLLPEFDTSGEARFMHPVNLSHAREEAYGADPASPEVRRGRRIFHFARNERLSHGGSFACATCHIEGTHDGLVWIITDGPRQTISLAGRLEDTAPFNWTGTREELQGNMTQTIERMGGLGLAPAELDDLEAFLLSMETSPNPNVAAAGLTPLQQWGFEIFMRPDVGCTTCHAGDGTTDGGLHDVGVSSSMERDLRAALIESGVDLPAPGLFNTPSLRGLWATAPYFHDGSAADLEEVLERTSDQGTMGRTDLLFESEREALLAFLETL